MLKAIERVAPDTLEFTLLHKMEALVRPADVLAHLFGLDTETIRNARVTKLSAVPSMHQAPVPAGR
jgi:hypothetical protein